MKKIFKWGAIIIVGLIVIGLFFGDGEEDGEVEVTEEESTEANSDSEDNKKDEGKKESEEENKDETKTANIGDTATISDFSFTVNGVEEKEEINDGNEFTEPATTSGKFVIVDVTVKNDKKESVTIDSSFFKLLDSNGTEYDPNTSGDVIMNMTDEDDFFLEQVNPGLEKTGKVVFEVGADVDVASSVLEAQTGFWGTEKVKINLK
ncbi:DUF4352 domain-containing protein [Allobacillus sp. SKP2-8]|uniref:DUF4352 domain-containing protein n=1 Tax=unclassified Allobacillus TaxID=2628859 RepID=UPI0011828A31|nr:DUF4352 domain-containing protein [Allobacillus sp. SKP2-8]TSJ61836.1 DUF4352 domain-containing protein [Allobacillus sp. SKP2-8]